MNLTIPYSNHDYPQTYHSFGGFYLLSLENSLIHQLALLQCKSINSYKVHSLKYYSFMNNKTGPNKHSFIFLKFIT